MAPQGVAKFTDWHCGSCTTSVGKPFRNFGFRTSCLQCGAVPPKGARKPRNTFGTAQSGSAPPRARDVAAGGIARAVSQAMGPVYQKLGLQSFSRATPGATTDDKDKKIAELRQQLAKLQSGAGAAPQEVGEGDMPVDEDERKTALRKEWDLAAARVQHLRATPVLLQGDDHTGQLEQLVVQAKAAEDRYRAHGTSEQQRSAYLLREEQRAARAATAAADKAKAKHEQVRDLEARLEVARKEAVEVEGEAAKALAAATAASEARMAHAARQPPVAATVVATMEAGVAPPGFVSVAFANEKWEEREAAFAQQLAQLQALVASQGPTGDAASEATPSEAGDVASAAQLEDDDAWSAVDRSKRKALLRRERDALASKVKTHLGKIRSQPHSPFKKCPA